MNAQFFNHAYCTRAMPGEGWTFQARSFSFMTADGAWLEREGLVFSFLTLSSSNLSQGRREMKGVDCSIASNAEHKATDDSIARVEHVGLQLWGWVLIIDLSIRPVLPTKTSQTRHRHNFFFVVLKKTSLSLISSVDGFCSNSFARGKPRYVEKWSLPKRDLQTSLVAKTREIFFGIARTAKSKKKKDILFLIVWSLQKISEKSIVFFFSKLDFLIKKRISFSLFKKRGSSSSPSGIKKNFWFFFLWKTLFMSTLTHTKSFAEKLRQGKQFCTTVLHVVENKSD